MDELAVVGRTGDLAAVWRMQKLCSGRCRTPPFLQLTNAQFQKVKSIKGADVTDALVRKDIQASLCKIAGAGSVGRGLPVWCPP